MTADLYLIAHKVRGEPAFDVATTMICPECSDGDDCEGCAECDGTGLWWIIPTSGHRAYPYYDVSLNEIDGTFMTDIVKQMMPEGLPDHYTTQAEPQRSLADALGLTARKPAPPTRIHRRL